MDRPVWLELVRLVPWSFGTSSSRCRSEAPRRSLSPLRYRSVRYLPDRESAWMERHRPFCCPERTGKRPAPKWQAGKEGSRSEEHTSELQSLMRISYAVFCLKKKTILLNKYTTTQKHTHPDIHTNQRIAHLQCNNRTTQPC